MSKWINFHSEIIEFYNKFIYLSYVTVIRNEYKVKYGTFSLFHQSSVNVSQ